MLYTMEDYCSEFEEVDPCKYINHQFFRLFKTQWTYRAVKSKRLGDLRKMKVEISFVV